jgi:hypothetical protein
MRRTAILAALLSASTMGLVHASPVVAGPTSTAGTVQAGQTVAEPASTPCVDKSSPRLAPAPNFDPTTSSDESLAAAGFPPRPDDKNQLKAWIQLAKTYSAGGVWNCNDVPPDAATVADPGGLNGDISKWVGWAAHNATFKDTDGNLDALVPTGPADGQPHVLGFWNGINLGGSAAHPIFQSGVHTEVGTDSRCLVLYEGWFPGTGAPTWNSGTTYAAGAVVKAGTNHDVNHQYMSLVNGNTNRSPVAAVNRFTYWAPSEKQHPMTFGCDTAPNTTDYVYVHTTLNGSAVHWKIWDISIVPNENAAFNMTVVYPSSVSADGHAEWILENAYTTSLGDFGLFSPVYLYNNRAYAASLGWKNLSDLSGYAYNIGPLYEGSVLKAVSWTVDSSGDFPVFYCQTTPPQC